MSLARTGVGPEEPRYIYPTIFFVVLLAAEACLLLVPRNPIPIVLAAILGLGALGSAPGLNQFGDTLRAQATGVRVGLTAGELLHNSLPPGYKAFSDYVQLDQYDRAASAYHSSIAWSPQQIPGRSEAERDALDAELIRVAYPAPKPAAGPAPSGCPQVPGNGKDAIIKLMAGHLYVKPGAAPVQVRFRRFGSVFPGDAQFQVTPGDSRTLTLVHDRSNQPWIAAVRSTAPFEACPT